MRRSALLALGTFLLAIGSAPLFALLASPGSTLAWKAWWVLLCFLSLRLVHGMGFQAALSELGLRAPVAPASTAAMLSSLPMLITFALTSPRASTLALGPLLMTSVVSPLSEELLFRGYLFLQLYRRARWPFMAAIAATAVAFGLAHAPALAGRSGLGPLAAEMGMIALGGAFYSWLLVAWHDNLWFPITLHAAMNLWCFVFDCDAHVGSWTTNVGRVLSIGVALALSGLVRRREARAAEPQDGPHPPQ